MVGSFWSALDVRTITSVCGVVHLAVAVVPTYQWFRQRTYAGFGAWVLAGWSSFLGILLVSLRGVVPDVLSYIVSNLLLVSTPSFITIGIVRFTGGHSRLWRHGAYLGLVALGLVFFTFRHPSLQARILLISATVSATALTSAHLARRRLPEVLADMNPLVVGCLLFVGGFYALRVVVTVLVPPINDYFAPSHLQAVALLIYLCGHTTLIASLLVLNAQRLERELSLSQEESKALRGIIPICAHCKKIRDDQGAWNQLEAYIRAHSEATFSHGICPECAREVFGPDSLHKDASYD
jgi:hypothetical protein